MKKILLPTAIILTTVLFSACAQNKQALTPEERSMIQEARKQSLVGENYQQLGTRKYKIEHASIESETGCKVSYSHFQVEGEDPKAKKTFVVAHGFMRSKKRLRGLAEHLASWGNNVVTMSFCNAKFYNGHHDRNAKDMIKLVDHLGLDEVIYSGFSAGGLASFIAASQDERTHSYLGLDMVDHRSMGKDVAKNLNKPVYGLVAESSACNAKQNSFPAFLALNEPALLLKVEGATHCDFEFPYDKKCAWVCGRRLEGYDNETVQETIISLVTSYLLWQRTGDEAAKNYWDETSENFQILKNKKYIRKLDLSTEPAK